MINIPVSVLSVWSVVGHSCVQMFSEKRTTEHTDNTENNGHEDRVMRSEERNDEQHGQ